MHSLRIAAVAIGATCLAGWAGLAFDPPTGVLFGSMGPMAALPDAIYTISKSTAVPTLVGSTGLGKVDIPHAQAHAFGNPQSGTVDDGGHEVVSAGQVCEPGHDFFVSGIERNTAASFCAYPRTKFAQVHLQNVLVEEEMALRA